MIIIALVYCPVASWVHWTDPPTNLWGAAKPHSSGCPLQIASPRNRVLAQYPYLAQKTRIEPRILPRQLAFYPRPRIRFGLGAIYHHLLNVLNSRHKCKSQIRNATVNNSSQLPRFNNRRANTGQTHNTHNQYVQKMAEQLHCTATHRWRSDRRPCLHHRIKYPIVVSTLNLLQMLLGKKD